MRPDDILDAIGNTDDELIENANRTTKAPMRRKSVFTLGIAAILALILLTTPIVFSVLSQKTPAGTDSSRVSSSLIAKAIYPTTVLFPVDDYGEKYNLWNENKNLLQKDFREMNLNTDSFIQKTLEVFLKDTENQNRIISPLNLYMAFAMLAEITDGESRQELLTVLEVNDIETLQKKANALWKAHYSDDGVITSHLASSLWLDDDIVYQKETLDKLSEIYYASSFSGQMGDEEYDQMLKAWLNEQTGGLLGNTSNDIQMDPNTVMTLATTVLFQAKWGCEFSESETEKGIFHAPNQDITCDFMKESGFDSYYWGDQFSAIKKPLSGNYVTCGMWFILPDEGVSVNDLFADEQATQFLLSDGNNWEQTKYLEVNLSVPKFDVSSDINLKDGMQKLGINSVFDSTQSNFSPLTQSSLPIELTSADHSVRVAIDEEGCTASAMTTMNTVGAPAPLDEKIDFTLDRPFVFVITSEVGLPLFVGIVNQPIE